MCVFLCVCVCETVRVRESETEIQCVGGMWFKNYSKVVLHSFLTLLLFLLLLSDSGVVVVFLCNLQLITDVKLVNSVEYVHKLCFFHFCHIE